MSEKVWLVVGSVLLFWIGMVGSGQSTTLELPKPRLDGNVSVEKAIGQRRTVRSFRETPLSLAQLSQLLWAGQGITDPRGGLRAAPSGGALYPLDIYVAVGKQSVERLKEGVYRYSPERHCLVPVLQRDSRRELAVASLMQMWVASAPIVFVITVEYSRITSKYGERGKRYALIEAGHVAQNLFLQAEAIGLGVGIVGAFEDLEVAKGIGAPVEHEPLLVMPVGYRR